MKISFWGLTSILVALPSAHAGLTFTDSKPAARSTAGAATTTAPAIPTAPITVTGATQSAPATRVQKVETVRVSSAAPTPVTSTEDWKGTPDSSHASLGAFTGLGVVDSHAGFALLGTASTKIAQDGWITDVNDSVSAEAYVGPVFTSGTSAFAYSLHLRWDFKKDESWTFYGLGGLGGKIQSGALGGHFELFPRFAVGAFYDAGLPFLIRAEVSHELIGVGINFRL